MSNYDALISYKLKPGSSPRLCKEKCFAIPDIGAITKELRKDVETLYQDEQKGDPCLLTLEAVFQQMCNSLQASDQLKMNLAKTFRFKRTLMGWDNKSSPNQSDVSESKLLYENLLLVLKTKKPTDQLKILKILAAEISTCLPGFKEKLSHLYVGLISDGGLAHTFAEFRRFKVTEYVQGLVEKGRASESMEIHWIRVLTWYCHQSIYPMLTAINSENINDQYERGVFRTLNNLDFYNRPLENIVNRQKPLDDFFEYMRMSLTREAHINCATTHYLSEAIHLAKQAARPDSLKELKTIASTLNYKGTNLCKIISSSSESKNEEYMIADKFKAAIPTLVEAYLAKDDFIYSRDVSQHITESDIDRASLGPAKKGLLKKIVSNKYGQREEDKEFSRRSEIKLSLADLKLLYQCGHRDFRNFNLRDIELIDGCDFSYADFSGSQFERVTFKESSMASTRWRDVTFKSVDFFGFSKVRADYIGSYLSKNNESRPFAVFEGAEFFDVLSFDSLFRGSPSYDNRIGGVLKDSWAGVIMSYKMQLETLSDSSAVAMADFFRSHLLGCFRKNKPDVDTIWKDLVWLFDSIKTHVAREIFVKGVPKKLWIKIVSSTIYAVEVTDKMAKNRVLSSFLQTIGKSIYEKKIINYSVFGREGKNSTVRALLKKAHDSELPAVIKFIGKKDICSLFGDMTDLLVMLRRLAGPQRALIIDSIGAGNLPKLKQFSLGPYFDVDTLFVDSQLKNSELLNSYSPTWVVTKIYCLEVLAAVTQKLASTDKHKLMQAVCPEEKHGGQDSKRINEIFRHSINDRLSQVEIKEVKKTIGDNFFNHIGADNISLILPILDDKILIDYFNTFKLTSFFGLFALFTGEEKKSFLLGIKDKSIKIKQAIFQSMLGKPDEIVNLLDDLVDQPKLQYLFWLAFADIWSMECSRSLELPTIPSALEIFQTLDVDNQSQAIDGLLAVISSSKDTYWQANNFYRWITAVEENSSVVDKIIQATEQANAFPTIFSVTEQFDRLLMSVSCDADIKYKIITIWLEHDQAFRHGSQLLGRVFSRGLRGQNEYQKTVVEDLVKQMRSSYSYTPFNIPGKQEASPLPYVCEILKQLPDANDTSEEKVAEGEEKVVTTKVTFLCENSLLGILNQGLLIAMNDPHDIYVKLLLEQCSKAMAKYLYEKTDFFAHASKHQGKFSALLDSEGYCDDIPKRKFMVGRLMEMVRLGDDDDLEPWATAFFSFHMLAKILPDLQPSSGQANNNVKAELKYDDDQKDNENKLLDNEQQPVDLTTKAEQINHVLFDLVGVEILRRNFVDENTPENDWVSFAALLQVLTVEQRKALFTKTNQLGKPTRVAVIDKAKSDSRWLEGDEKKRDMAELLRKTLLLDYIQQRETDPRRYRIPLIGALFGHSKQQKLDTARKILLPMPVDDPRWRQSLPLSGVWGRPKGLGAITSLVRLFGKNKPNGPQDSSSNSSEDVQLK